MCSGMVHPNIVIDAFTGGADGVMIFGCLMDDCHYIDGNKIMENRQQAIELMLSDLGLEPERLNVTWVSGGKWRKFSRVIGEFYNKVAKLGPNPFA